MTRAATLGVLLALLVSSSACTSSRHLVFTTSTKFGVDISTTAGTNTGLMFGYKRYEGAYVPVDPKQVDENGDPDMASLLAVLDLTNGWFSGVDVFQLFATGSAAEQAARDPDTLAKVIAQARGGRDGGAANGSDDAGGAGDGDRAGGGDRAGDGDTEDIVEDAP